ncbi:MAG: TMEM165/GDT1 family protein [Mycobacterium sp.]
MIEALWLSTAVIFVAELGDKSQLMAMTFATRYRARDVLIGITAATALVHLASVGIGYAIGTSFEKYQSGIAIVAGIAFLAFAAWTLRGDELSAEEEGKAKAATGSALVAVGFAFFLAELGDKTMLATITLAADNNWLAVWIGSTLGMVVADGLAIIVGAVAGKHLPERLIQIVAAALFLLFGVFMLLQNLFAGAPFFGIALATAAILGLVAVGLRYLPEKYRPAVLKPAPVDAEPAVAQP